MPRDRLVELQERSAGKAKVVPAPTADQHVVTVVDETGDARRVQNFGRLLRSLRRPRSPTRGPEQTDDEDVEGYLRQAAQLTDDLALIRRDVEEITRQQCRQLNSPRHQQEAWELTQQLCKDVISKLSSSKQRLDELQRKFTAATPGLSRTEASMVQIQINTVRRQLLDVVQLFNNEQVSFKERKKEHLKRQLAITETNMSDEELEDIIEKGDTQIFNESILLRTTEARLALNEAEDRYKQLRELETSIGQVHEMFLQISLLVEEQGSMIDSIEANVLEGVENTTKGREQLREAEKKKQKGRKMMIICAILVGVLLLILIIILISYLG